MLSIITAVHLAESYLYLEPLGNGVAAHHC